MANKTKIAEKRMLMVALMFLLAGVFFLLMSYGLISIRWDFLKFWPGLLIFFGIEAILRFFLTSEE
ncbi:MAG: hypothetical protein ACI9BD_000685 [Candidatus Marinamargulisbacteria bacterium]|jgi:hypothetical protein